MARLAVVMTRTRSCFPAESNATKILQLELTLLSPNLTLLQVDNTIHEDACDSIDDLRPIKHLLAITEKPYYNVQA